MRNCFMKWGKCLYCLWGLSTEEGEIGGLAILAICHCSSIFCLFWEYFMYRNTSRSCYDNVSDANCSVLDMSQCEWFHNVKHVGDILIHTESIPPLALIWGENMYSLYVFDSAIIMLQPNTMISFNCLKDKLYWWSKHYTLCKSNICFECISDFMFQLHKIGGSYNQADMWCLVF